MTDLWITSQEVRDLTQIQQNVDNYLFDNEIRYIQITKIESCLTKELIERIDLYVKDSKLETPLITDEDISDLWNLYIKPAMANHVFVAALPNIAVRVTNKGVFYKQDNTNDNAQQLGVEFLRGEHKQRADTYLNQMIVYLKDNLDKYPEYDNCVDCEDKKGFNFGIDYTGQ